MSNGSMIQQHYYARAREGLFRSNEGLDTVAKSASLDNSFIKKTLQLFCVYHAPQELRQRLERDLSLYPEALTVFTADSGELVIGRGIFAGADFTGQRDSIFVHQYVIPAERKEQAIRSGDPIFRIRDFQSEYDGETKSLPELNEIPCGKGADLAEERETLERLGVAEERFKQLLWSIMMSISSNKKVYIALQVDISESSLYAKRLLSILYRCLPYGMRRKFGFMTYNHEPQGKRFINVMFVEKGSIRPGERNVEKDYLFDFASDRYMNVEPQGTEHYYLDFAWANRERPDKLEDFFAFAEEALQDRDESSSSLATYYQLCALYLVEQGSDGLYEANKEAVMSGVLDFLSADNVERKPRMNGLFWKLVERESSLFGSGYTPSLKYAGYIIDYYRVGGAGPKLLLPIFRMLRNGAKYNEDESYSVRLLQTMLQKYGELFKQVMTSMLRDLSSEEVVERYIASRLEPIAVMPGLQEEMLFWLKHVDEALCVPYVQKLFIDKAKQLLARDPERIKSGRGLDKFLETMYREKGDKAKQLQQFYDDLDLQARQAIIAHTDPEHVTQPQLENVRYMFDDRPEMLSDSLTAQERSVFDVLSCASDLLRNTNMREEDSYERLSRLGPQETDKLQELLQRLLRGKVRTDNYEKIAYAFYISGSKKKDFAFDYRKMLDFVHQESVKAEDRYDFLNWAAAYSYFRSPEGGIPDAFIEAIRAYFHEKARGEITKREVWLKLKGVRNETFRQLYKEIRDAQSNAIVRFVRKWKRTVLFSSVIVAAAALVSGGFIAYNAWQKPAAPVSPSTADGKQAENGSGGSSGGSGSSAASDRP